VHSFIYDTLFDEVINTSIPKISTENKKVLCDKEVQVFIPQTMIPEIRKRKNTSEEVRNAITTVSYRSGISVPKARVAPQAVCEILYDHRFLLKPPSLPTIPEASETNEPLNKKPRSAEDYIRYKDVLPDVKSVNKHKKALYQEIHAAKVLINKVDSSKIKLHYDTTSRSRIDGEWPCLIINVIDSEPVVTVLCDIISHFSQATFLCI
jgi:hypothetical protein